MNLSMMRVILLSIMLPLIGCRPMADQQAAAQSLLDADKAFAQASIDHGAAEAFNRFLAEDALQLSHGSAPTNGREAIVGGMGGEYSLTWEPQRAEVSASDDLGWTWGTYIFEVPQDDGGSSVSHGKYLNVWRKPPGGDWEVIVDMGNQSPAP